MPLEGLDQIDWGALTHAQGSANDIPGQLKRAAFPATDVRREALMWLMDRLHAEGCICEATPKVVPFFIELLNTPRVGDKDLILTMLGHFARSRVTDLSSQNRGDSASQPSPEVQREIQWVLETRAKIEEGAESYIPFLDHEQPPFRVAAAYALSTCVENPMPVAEALRARFKKEIVDIVRASILMALGQTGDMMDGPVFRDVIASGEGYLARWAAGASLILQWERQAAPEAVEVIIELISTSGPARDLFKRLPWGSGDLNADSGEILSFAGPKAAPVIVPQLVKAFGTAQPVAAVTIARALLDLVFPKGYTEGEEGTLSNLQRTVVSTMAKSHRLGEQSPLKELLKAKNLPSDRPSLLQFCGEGE